MSEATKPSRKPRERDDEVSASPLMREVPKEVLITDDASGVPVVKHEGMLGVQLSSLTEHKDAPPARPYVFDAKQTKDLSVAIKLAMNVLLTGPTGCGKTSVIGALAYVAQRPLVRFNCDGETRVSNLRGQQRPAAKDGVLTLVFSLGALAKAMMEGWWVLLDEIDAALPSVLFVLQSVLEEDRRVLVIPETGKTIVAHPDFRIFATGNTIGYRAVHRGKHAGTNPMNSAFVDRFGAVIAVDYPGREEELRRILVNVPSIDRAYADGISRVAEKLRTDTKFKADFSTRRCEQWARLVTEYDTDILRAAELSVLRKFENATDAKVAREVICRQFGYPVTP